MHRARIAAASFSLVLCFAVSGCGGVETFYYYSKRNESDSWRVYSATTSEKKTNSGTKFRYRTDEYTILVQLDGNWSGWDMFGYLFVPLVPLKSPGEYIDITYQLSNLSEGSSAKIGTVLLLLDDNPAPRQTVLPLGGEETSTSGILRVERPPYVPKSISLRFDQATDRNKPIEIPDLILTVHTEKCYWYGDSEAHYVRCNARTE